MTKRGTVYGDLFRYAKDETLKRVWTERMEAEFESYPDVNILTYQYNRNNACCKTSRI